MEDAFQTTQTIQDGIPASWGETADKAWRSRLAKAVEARAWDGALDMVECIGGIEIHLLLDTGRKLFSPLPQGSAAHVDLGLPGALPMLCPLAQVKAAALGQAVGARPPPLMAFERKRYAYPDLSKGYQTTQKSLCAWSGGELEFEGQILPLDRAQIEEDAARSARSSRGFEMDFSRAGSPLLEVVSHARSMLPEQAAGWAKALWLEARHVQASLCEIEASGFKTDINISICPKGLPWGRRVEIKGIGPFDDIRTAAEEAFWLLAAELAQGRCLGERTMAFDPASRRLETMRAKQDESQYRFLPDGDLIPRKPLGWDSKPVESYRSAFEKLLAMGAGGQLRMLWQDPDKAWIARQACSMAPGCESSLPLAATAFFSSRKPQATRSAQASCLAWALREAASGSDKTSSIQAAIAGLERSAFDPKAAAAALAAAPEAAPEPAVRTAIEKLLESDPKAAQAAREVEQGKPKAAGYIAGQLRKAHPEWDPRSIGTAIDSFFSTSRSSK